MNKTKKLPIDESSFEKFYDNGLIYVDKTQYIARMIEEGSRYFLSRPRRMGKSLLVSTLECFFQGKRDLFEGTWIEQNFDWEWEEHPVVILDFNGIDYETPDYLERSLTRNLISWGKHYNIKLDDFGFVNIFQELIVELQKRFSKRVVVLIDEYDKAIISHLGEGIAGQDIAKRNRNILKRLFGVLKESQVTKALQFLFLTGVTKFARTSIFSELNNLSDLTLDERYSTFLGYTQTELIENFSSPLQRFAKAKQISNQQLVQEITHYYNGYRFTEDPETVYNPYSVTHCLHRQKFLNFWFETGTPTLLTKLLKERDYLFTDLEGTELKKDQLSSYDIDSLEINPLLLQTGYLTIKNFDNTFYELGFPNKEVKDSFANFVINSFFESKQPTAIQISKLSRQLLEENTEEFFQNLHAIFADIPYNLSDKKDEAYFHALTYLMLITSGIDVRCEVLTNRGRSDLVVLFQSLVYVMEFKCDQTAEAALSQIREKGYAEKYQGSGKKVILMGINFSSVARNVEEWRTETPTF